MTKQTRLLWFALNLLSFPSNLLPDFGLWCFLTPLPGPSTAPFSCSRQNDKQAKCRSPSSQEWWSSWTVFCQLEVEPWSALMAAMFVFASRGIQRLPNSFKQKSSFAHSEELQLPGFPNGARVQLNLSYFVSLAQTQVKQQINKIITAQKIRRSFKLKNEGPTLQYMFNY